MSYLEFTQGQLVEVPEFPGPDEPDEVWEPILDAYDAAKRVPCVTCGRCPTEEGHDACIANLPGVLFACCGHGVLEPKSRHSHCYLAFDDGLVLHDAAAFACMEMLGGQPAPIPDVRRRPWHHGVKIAGDDWVALMKLWPK